MSVDFVFRKIIIKMARPTATSAAATTITKNTNTCALLSPKYLENATINKFTAFSINSTHMKMIIAFLLNKTPSTPIQNKATLK